MSLASSTVGLNAGRDALVMVFDDYQSNVVAGQDALVVAFGGAEAGIIAGRDAGVFSIDYAIGNIDAARYAGLATWGTAAGPFVVDGAAGASAWVYRDFNGEVRAANGDAFLAVYGNAVGAEKAASAGRDALVWVVGDFLGMVEAGEYAGAIVLGNFNGSLTSGVDGFILSEGNVRADMTTGRDLFVWAIGDVRGNYHAGRDASVITYADFDAALRADRDIGRSEFNYYGLPGVRARGNISGTIDAGRNIGYWADGAAGNSEGVIFSFGSIDAVIRAANASGSPIGGHIGRVEALGPIDGLVKASVSVTSVRSGDGINAAIIAPQIGPVVEYNASLVANHPYPATPDSVKADVLAAANADHLLVLAARQQVADDIVTLLDDFADAKADAFAELAQTIAAVQAANAQTRAEVRDALAKLRSDTIASLQRMRTEGRDAIQALRVEADEARNALDAACQQVLAQRNAAWQEAAQDKQQEAQDLLDADQAMAAAHADALADSAIECQVRNEIFDAMIRELKEAVRDAKLAKLQEQWAQSWWSWCPLVGSSVSAYYAFARGQWGWGSMHAAFGLWDFFGAGKLVLGGLKTLMQRVAGHKLAQEAGESLARDAMRLGQKVPTALRPANFGTSTIAENAAMLRMWNNAMRSAATSSRSNGYIRYLEALARGQKPTQRMLEEAFAAVNSQFLKSARAAGMNVAAVHHWNFGKTAFPRQIVDPRHLVPTPSRILHEQIHRATSASRNIWGGRIAPQHEIPIPEWSTPWTPP